MSDVSMGAERVVDANVDTGIVYALFGGVRVRARNGFIHGGSPHQSALLAALLADAGRVVAVDTLVERVWGPAAPQRAHRTLHTYITRVRRLLEQAGPAVLTRRGDGYLLDVDRQLVDVHRFRSLADAAGSSGLTDTDRARLLRQALNLWGGEPLADLSSQWAARMREGLRQRRLDVVLAWAQLELTLGNATAVVEPLSGLAAEYPLHEPLAAALMGALHATGRKAEALAVYTDARRRLVDELGTEPGPELRQAHQAVLRDETPPAAGATLAPRRVRPAQLPPAVAGFVGREEQLARLDAMLDTAAGHPGVVTIAALSGTAGVGKTTLAIQWHTGSPTGSPTGSCTRTCAASTPRAGWPLRPR